MTGTGCDLLVAASAERGLARLAEGVTAAIVEFMLGALVESPHRVGHQLQRELAGLWAAPRGPYRVVYDIEEDRQVVTVLRIDHRSDVYRPR